MENDINITPPPLEPTTANGSLPLAGQAPEPIPVQPKPKTRLIVLLVILGVAIAGYFVSAKYLDVWPFQVSVSIPTFTLRPSPILTSTTSNQLEGWQTYRNDKYGFEISYPSYFTNIEVSPYNNGFITTASDSDLELDLVMDYSLDAAFYQPNTKINCFYFDNRWNPYEYDLKTKNWDINVYNTNKLDCPQMITNINQVAIYDTPFDNFKKFAAFIPDNKSNKMIRIIMIGVKTFDENKKIWDQILSTFKFIEPTP